MSVFRLSVTTIGLLLSLVPMRDAQGVNDDSAMLQLQEQVSTRVSETGQLKGQILLQEDNVLLGRSLVGSTVYSSDNELVGKVSDVLINVDGTLRGVVIETRRILFVARLRIAFEMTALQIVQEEAGAIRLLVDATKVEIDEAPWFKTATLRQREPKPTSPLP